MAIGSINNLAFALNEVKQGHLSSSASERLALIIVADEASSGGAIIDLDVLKKQLTHNTVAIAYRDLLILAQYGLLRVSDNHDGRCFCALPIADHSEIQRARQFLNCHWPFVRGPGTDD